MNKFFKKALVFFLKIFFPEFKTKLFSLLAAFKNN